MKIHSIEQQPSFCMNLTNSEIAVENMYHTILGTSEAEEFTDKAITALSGIGGADKISLTTIKTRNGTRINMILGCLEAKFRGIIEQRSVDVFTDKDEAIKTLSEMGTNLAAKLDTAKGTYRRSTVERARGVGPIK